MWRHRWERGTRWGACDEKKSSEDTNGLSSLFLLVCLQHATRLLTTNYNLHTCQPHDHMTNYYMTN